MKPSEDMLDLICRRIASLEAPAYIKDGELRYVAVNDAYARFFGKQPADFTGRRSAEMFARKEDAERENHERRALIFASEEKTTCLDSAGAQLHTVEIESFELSKNKSYILGLFQKAEQVAMSAPAASAPGDWISDVERACQMLETLDQPQAVAKPVEAPKPVVAAAAVAVSVPSAPIVVPHVAVTQAEAKQAIQPAAAVTPVAAPKPVVVAPTTPKPMFTLEGKRVLVAAENEIYRHIVTSQLSLWNMDAVGVESGATAFFILESALSLDVNTDLLLLDQRLPDMSGNYLLHKLRSDPRFAQLPVILMLPDTMQPNSVTLSQIQGCLTKPVDFNKMRHLVLAALGGEPEAQPVPSVEDEQPQPLPDWAMEPVGLRQRLAG